MWITLSRYPHPNTTNNNNNWIGNPFRITFIKLLIITVNLFQDESSGTERNRAEQSGTERNRAGGFVNSMIFPLTLRANKMYRANKCRPVYVLTMWALAIPN
jgi:hypothetical protein